MLEDEISSENLVLGCSLHEQQNVKRGGGPSSGNGMVETTRPNGHHVHLEEADGCYKTVFETLQHLDTKVLQNGQHLLSELRFERAASVDLPDPPSSELSRAMSWPLLATPRPSLPPDSPPPAANKAPRRFVLRPAGRLWQHYYPEGGWGWVVVTVSVLVHVLTHGLQLSFAMLISPIATKFPPHDDINAGQARSFSFTRFYVRE